MTGLYLAISSIGFLLSDSLGFGQSKHGCIVIPFIQFFSIKCVQAHARRKAKWQILSVKTGRVKFNEISGSELFRLFVQHGYLCSSQGGREQLTLRSYKSSRLCDVSVPYG